MAEEINEDMQSSRFEGFTADRSTLELLLSPEYILQKMRHSLLGEILVGDPRDNEWKQIRDPIMDAEGINDYMQVMENTIGVPQELTKMTKKEMNVLLATALNNAYDFVFFKSEQYGLQDSNFSTLMSITEINFTTFLNKTVGGFKAGMIKGMFGIKENVSKSEKMSDKQEQKPSAPWWGNR